MESVQQLEAQIEELKTLNKYLQGCKDSTMQGYNELLEENTTLRKENYDLLRQIYDLKRSMSLDYINLPQ